MKYIFIAVSLATLSHTIIGYNSQVGQDKFLNEHFFHNKKDGVFIDIGAYDGVTHSNTYFFEKELGWKGICFEPIPSVFKKLTQTRQCTCINACVGDKEESLDFIEVSGAPEMLSGIVKSYDPRHLDRLKLEITRDGGSYEIKKVPSVTLNKIAKYYNLSYVDFLSLDTEGSELDILRSIDFEKVYIHIISVENNYHEPYIREFLESKGFQYVTMLGYQDEVYINSLSYLS